MRIEPNCLGQGMYLSDLTFIEEGTPNFTENGLLNFAKMRMVRIESPCFLDALELVLCTTDRPRHPGDQAISANAL